MKFDRFGQAHCSSAELADTLYVNPNVDISAVFVDDPENYTSAVKEFYVDFPITQV